MQSKTKVSIKEDDDYFEEFDEESKNFKFYKF